MGKQAGTTRNVSTTGPADISRPFIESLLSRAETQFAGGPPQYFPGSTVAPLTPRETAAGSQIEGVAGDLGAQFAGTINPALNFALTDALNVGSNPFLAQAAEGAVRPIFQNLTESVLPNIRQESIAAGSAGSTRAGLAEAQAVERTSRAALDATNQLYSNAYGQGLSTLLSGLNLVPQLQQAQLAGPQALAGVGAQERAVEQARLNEEVQRYLFNQAAPYQALQEFGNIVSRPFGGESTSTVEGTPASTTQQIAGLIATLLPAVPGLADILGSIFGGGGAPTTNLLPQTQPVAQGVVPSQAAPPAQSSTPVAPVVPPVQQQPAYLPAQRDPSLSGVIAVPAPGEPGRVCDPITGVCWTGPDRQRLSASAINPIR